MKYDLVLYGATSFTGSLATEYLIKEYGAKPKDFKWAIGARDKDKAEQLKESISKLVKDASVKDVPVILADVNDRRSLDEMCSQTRVICTTVGPYTKYGRPLVEACVNARVHCCDLTGESFYVRDIVNEFHEKARDSGAKIIPSCGFDSIPPDLGTFMMAEHLRKVYGRGMKECKYFMMKSQGGMSGGTMASVMIILDQTWKGGVKTMKEYANPFLLLGDKDGGEDSPSVTCALATRKAIKPPHPEIRRPTYEKAIDGGKGGWLAPLVFAAHDSKIVYRSDMLLSTRHAGAKSTKVAVADVGGYGGGRPFFFREGLAIPGKVKGFFAALMVTISTMILPFLLVFPVTSYLLHKFCLPAPGEGPSRKQREEGFFKCELVAKAHSKEIEHGGGKGEDEIVIRGYVGSDLGDPGYHETAKMLIECGMCLVKDSNDLPYRAGGVLTPASAFGPVLLRRLRDKGMTFDVVTD